MAIVNVTDSSFQQDVMDSETPVLVDFWADWCGPCKQMAPALDDISKEYEGRVTIAKMNIDDEPDTPVKYHVRGLPTFMIFKGGQVIATKVGPMSRGAMASWLEDHA